MKGLNKKIQFLYLSLVLSYWVQDFYALVNIVKFHNPFFQSPHLINLLYTLVLTVFAIKRFWRSDFDLVANLLIDIFLWGFSLIVEIIAFLLMDI